MFLALGPSRIALPALSLSSVLVLCSLLTPSRAAIAQDPQDPQPVSASPAVTAPNPAVAEPVAPPVVADPSAQTVPTDANGQATGSQASTPAPVPIQANATPQTAQQAPTSEEDLKKLLVGKLLYLRGGYLDDSLSFNEHGILSGHSPQGSYTLAAVSIERVRLTKHKVELEGQRYGLHFLGALPSEDPTAAMDRVQITPRKKVLKISIDRETLISPKKNKEKQKSAAPAHSAQRVAIGAAGSSQQVPEATDEAAQAKAEMAAAPEAERPSDPQSVTSTTSPAHAAGILNQAIDRIFSVGFDDRMMAAMPDFWKLYYQAVAARTDYRPKDPAVFRQNAVDKKGRLVSVFEPASNEYAQAHGVAGLALYHVVIGADGKPGEIAVARPIGFGLDESAVSSIRKAAFEPAMKGGQPVSVVLDLIVEFHIYSARTGTVVKSEVPDTRPVSKESLEAQDQTAAPILPGPYSVQHPIN